MNPIRFPNTKGNRATIQPQRVRRIHESSRRRRSTTSGIVMPYPTEIAANIAIASGSGESFVKSIPSGPITPAAPTTP